MKILNFILLSFLSITFMFFYFFTGGGCARGPFDIETPTPTSTPVVTPTTGPTAIPQRVYQIEITLNGNLDQNKGFYIFAFNRPNPLNETEADPISTNADFWTDYVSFGPLTSQDADFVRRTRLLAGDITSNWNPTQFVFTTGTVTEKVIEIILPRETLDDPEDLYFNFITTDVNGEPRDALGFGLGTTTDSQRLKDLVLNTPYSFDDSLNDVNKPETLPEDVNPEMLDIVSGVIVLKDQ